jgi:hypothetical protein
MQLYKFLNFDGSPFHGGSGSWALPVDGAPGRWMPRIHDPGQCMRGYHLCRDEDLIYWLGPALYLAESRGPVIVSENKVVSCEVRLIRRIDTWFPGVAAQFAVECVERVIHYFEAAYPDDLRPRHALQAARKGAGVAFDTVGAYASAELASADADSDAWIDTETTDADAWADTDSEAASSWAAQAARIEAIATKAERANRGLKAARAARAATVAAARAAAAAAEAARAVGQARGNDVNAWGARAIRAVIRATTNAAEAAGAAKAATCADAWTHWAPAASPRNAERKWQNRRLLEILGWPPP